MLAMRTMAAGFPRSRPGSRGVLASTPARPPRQHQGTRRALPGRTSLSRLHALPRLLLFDCDGVLVETERDGHRVAFNEAFQIVGLPSHVRWDVDLYGELLETGGGKERMKVDFTNRVDAGDEELRDVIESKGGVDKLVVDLHALKTEIMMGMVEADKMPPRPGVRRLIGEAAKSGVRVGICSTSNEKAVKAVLKSVLNAEGPALSIDEDEIPVFAGDIVPKKKPDPAVYTLAAKEMIGDDWESQVGSCLVIEDSRIGAQAAKSAGMKCIVTKSIYTEGEAFDDIGVDAVFDCIGDAADERFKLDKLPFAL